METIVMTEKPEAESLSVEEENAKLKQQLVAFAAITQEREQKIREALGEHMTQTLKQWREKAAAVVADRDSRLKAANASIEALQGELVQNKTVLEQLRESIITDAGLVAVDTDGDDALADLEKRLEGLEDLNLEAMASARAKTSEAFGSKGADAEAGDKKRADQVAGKLKDAEAALDAAHRQAEVKVASAQADVDQAVDSARQEAAAALDAVLSEVEVARGEAAQAKQVEESLRESHQAVLDAVIGEADMARQEQELLIAERDALRTQVAGLEKQLKG